MGVIPILCSAWTESAYFKIGVSDFSKLQSQLEVFWAFFETKILGNRFILDDLFSNSLMYRLKNGNFQKSSFQKIVNIRLWFFVLISICYIN